MRRATLLIGSLLFTACAGGALPREPLQPTGSGAVTHTATGDIGTNEATPETADSLEVPVASTGAAVHGTFTNEFSILFGDAPSKDKDFYVAPTMLEYVSYDCEYCREYILTVRPWIVQTYVATHKLNIERYYVPLTKQGEITGRAALCAARQGGFDGMDEYLLSHPAADQAAILKQAAAQKLSIPTMKFCLAEAFALTAPDGMDGKKIERVPAFTFGTTWLGVETKERFRELIEAGLKK